MRDIPLQRFAGSVSAFGAYGMPSLAGRRLSRRSLVILGFVGIMLGLYAAGVIDLSHVGAGGALAIGAGPTSAAVATDLTTKRQEHGTWLAQYKTADGYDMPADKVGEFQKRNAELTELQTAFETALQVEKSAAENDAKLAPQGRLIKDDDAPVLKAGQRLETKEHFDAAFKSAFEKNAKTLAEIAKGGRGTVSFDLPTDLKTTILTTVHNPTPDRRQDTGMALFFGNAEDKFPHGKTGSKSIDYFIQTTDTDNTAAVAEATAPTDNAFAWTLTTDPIETVSTWIPMTHESIGDNVGLQSTVQGRLAMQLQKKSSQIILSGTGVTPIPTGVFIRTGFQTQAKGADPSFDAIHKAITLVEVTGDSAPATDIFMHPTDWQNMRLTRTIDGVYILGNPADAVVPNLWGIPVTKTIGVVAAGTAGTAGVAATWQAEIVEREGLTVEISTEHSTFFTERKVAILLYRRFAVGDYRPSGFATVTGL